MAYRSAKHLLLSYNDVAHIFKQRNKQSGYCLVYGFYLNDCQDEDVFEIEQPSWLEVQDSGKTYASLRVHFPLKRGKGFLQTGTLLHQTNLKLFKNKEDAEEFLEIYLHNQRIKAQKAYDFFNKKLDILSKAVLP